MSDSRSKSFVRLGIIGGIILLALLIGQLAGEMGLVLDILGAIGLVLIGITILVTIHELGHFLTAKWFGMRVETFSIGFPPKLFGFKKGETEYQFGATPLGGYVKISGIIDESLDTDHLSNEPQPWEFRAKPVWQRLIVMTGGVIMNVILGIFIFSMMKFTYGETRLPMSEVKNGIQVMEPTTILPPGEADSVRIRSLGYHLGFRSGDELLTFKGQTFEYFEQYASQKNLIDDDAYYTIRRNGQEKRLDIPGNVQNLFSSDTIIGLLFEPARPAVVEVTDSLSIPSQVEGEMTTFASPAYEAGLRSGDRIVRLDSTPVAFFSDISQYMKHKANQDILVAVERGGASKTFTVKTTEHGYLGVGSPEAQKLYHYDTIPYGFFEAFIPGTKEAFGFLSTNVQGIKNLGREGVDAGKSIMGPVQIAKVYLDAFKNGGVQAFLRLTASLSMILALVNILPIPALDGGHVLFLLIEAITRREPSVKVRMIAQQIGMLLILGLMILVLFNDAFRLIS
jgi:regulator of sigma E protease